MQKTNGFSSKKLRSIIINIIIIFSMAFGSFNTVSAQDIGTPAPTETVVETPIFTETPDIDPTVIPTDATTQPSEVPTEITLEPTLLPTEVITEEPTSEPEMGDVNSQDLVANDNMANATLIETLPYTSIPVDTTSATIESGEIEAGERGNVCNATDIGSVWYTFTAPATGVFKVDITGSNYAPNITILKQSDSSAVVCGDTYNWSSENSSLAFNGLSGTTYLLGFSSPTGGTLQFSLDRLNCTSALCGAAVGGNGKVIHRPNIHIVSLSTGYQTGWANGDWNGFIHADLTNGGSGNYAVSTSGEGNLIINNSVTIPGIYSPSAVGYPKTSIVVKDTHGNEVSANNIAVALNSYDALGGFLGNTTIGKPLEIYTPAGEKIKLLAASNEYGFEVYIPEKTIINNGNPGIITMDASSTLLVRDTFTFNLDDLVSTQTYLYFQEMGYGFGLSATDDWTLTISAPKNTVIDYYSYQYNVTATDNMIWTYWGELLRNPITIIGGVSHYINLGGEISVNPSAIGAPFHVGSSNGTISSSILDAYNNRIYAQYHGNVGTSAASLQFDPLNESFHEHITSEGQIVNSLEQQSEIASQEYVTTYVYPEITILDASGNSVPTNPITSNNQTLKFDLPITSTPGVWSATESIDLGPKGTKTGITTFEVVIMSPPANDDMADARALTIGTTYAASTLGATVEAGLEPSNVCNSEDTKSVWYKFTAPSTGVYNINVFGSNYSPNLTVLKQVDLSSTEAVVCGDTSNVEYNESNAQLAFNATSGVKYLIGVSDSSGENLKIKITKLSCPTGELCGAVVGGSGKVVHYPDAQILDNNNNQIGYGNGNFNGFLHNYLYSGTSGTKRVLIAGENNFIMVENPVIPGLFTPTGIGLPKTTLTFLDTEGTSFSANEIYLSAENLGVIGMIGGKDNYKNAGSSFDFYALPGTYNYFVSDEADKLFIYQPGNVITSELDPGSITIDAQPLPKDTFTYTIDGTFSYPRVRYSASGWDSAQIDLSNGENVITYAAPEGTAINSTSFSGSKIDGGNLTWQYNMYTDSFKIEGGKDHPISVGGEFVAVPFVEDAPYSIAESTGKAIGTLQDEYGNSINGIYYYGNVFTSALSSQSIVSDDLIDSYIDLKIQGKENNSSEMEALDEMVQAQGWVSRSVYPALALKDGIGNAVTVDNTNSGYGYPQTFTIATKNPGTWTLSESVDTGPYQGVVTGDTTFDVYTSSVHKLDNDFVSEATLLTVPANITEYDTMGATTSSSDPSLTTCLLWANSSSDKSLGSVWYKYVASMDGMLSLDTIGSNYDTVLAVYSGTPSSSSRVKCNDDRSTDEPWDTDSSLDVVVKTGTTYYIEVADTGFGHDKVNNGAQAMEVQSQSDIEIQQIGGGLNLNASITPCYSVSTVVSPSTGGTVSIAPAANCGTKYTKDTKIYLTAKPKTNYNFWKWSDNNESTITTFTIGSDTRVTADFVANPGVPSLTSPASKALIFHDAAILKWAATSPVSDHYIVDIATDSLFTINLISTSVTGTTFTPDWLSPNTTYYWRVRGVNAVGAESSWSSVRIFRTAVLPPAIAGVFDDNQDLTGDDALHTNRPLFDWDQVVGATSYTIQISRNSTYTQLVTSATLTATEFIPTVNLPADIQLFWRVQAKAVNGPSRWSGGTLTTPPAPAYPTLVSPAHKALVYETKPILNWSDVAGAVSYDWQLSSDASFETVTLDGTVDTAPLTSQVEITSPLTSNMTYYWRVRTVNDAGNMSGWTTARILRTAILAPALTSPNDGDNTYILRPTFIWQSVDGNSGYSIQISRTESTLLLVGTYQLTTGTTSYTPTSDLPAHVDLWWRVQTKAANGPSNWTEWRKVSMPNPPGIPKQLSPSANKLVYIVDNPILDWTDSTLPIGSTLDHYQLVVSTSSKCLDGTYIYNEDFSNSSDTSGPSNPTNELKNSLLPNHIYYWQVKAFNKSFETSSWSSCLSFRTAVLAPELISPADGADESVTATNRPVFQWDEPDYSGATGFTIQISRDTLFKSLVVNSSLSGTTLEFTPAINLPANADLWWRVQTKAVNGPSLWSETRKFRVPPATAAPTLVSPKTNALTGQTPTFSWKAVTPPSGATNPNYKLEISQDKAFSSIIATLEATGTSVVVTETDPLDANTTYYWRVKLSYKIGETIFNGNWSTTQTIRVAVLSPVLNAPENLNTLRPRFDWEDVTGATGYTLQISKNNAFSSLVGTYATSAASSEYTPVTNLPANVSLYWRVQTKATNGPSAWVTANDPINTANPPSAPVLSSPSDKSTVTIRTPKLDWANSTLPAGELWDHYQVQISSTAAFDTIVTDKNITGGITDSQYTLETDLLEGITYYWRVRSHNGAGEFSSWSAVRWFKVNTINDTLRIKAIGEPDSLDPQKAYDFTGISHLDLIYEGLTRTDAGLNTIPAAAQSWEYNADATEIIFTLRPNLKYSDGSILNAKRFEYSLLRMIDPRIGSGFGYLIDMVEGAWAFRTADLETATEEELENLRSAVGIKAYDQWDEPCTNYTQTNCLTLKINFTSPTAYFHTIMSVVAAYPAKEEIILINGEDWWQNPSNHVGNGPFRITSYDTETKSSFSPNTSYREGIPTYKVEYKYFEDGEAALTAYQNDEIDIIQLDTDQVSIVKTDPVLSGQLEEYPGSCSYQITFNLTKEPFTDPKVREAFSYAMDRQGYADEVFGGGRLPTLSWIPQGFPGADENETSWDYNETLAQEALAASSYGSASALPTITVSYNLSDFNTTRWTWIQTQLYDVLGVEIVLDPQEDYLISDSDPSLNSQMGLIGWCADTPDPSNWMSPVWGEYAFMATNWGFENEAFQTKLDEADSTVADEDRNALYKDAQAMLVDGAPAIFLITQQNDFLVKPWMKGYTTTPMDIGWPGIFTPLSVYLK